MNYTILHGINIDQTDHIHENILNVYFPDKTKQILHQTSPFPLDPKLETFPFNTLPLKNDILQDLEEKFYGGFGHWVKTLQHVQEKFCPDLGYSVIQLSKYLSTPTMSCF